MAERKPVRTATKRTSPEPKRKKPGAKRKTLPAKTELQRNRLPRKEKIRRLQRKSKSTRGNRWLTQRKRRAPQHAGYARRSCRPLDWGHASYRRRKRSPKKC